MRSRWALLFVLMHIAGFSGAATAQTLDQQRCAGPDPDISIGACTAMIQAGQETQENIAKAFGNRGNAYFGKGHNPNYSFAYNGRGLAYARKAQYDRAIRDFDQAIRLYQDQAFAIPINPNFAQALSNRGAAYAFKGQYDRAIEDYDQAIRIIPDFADAFYNRGLTKRAKGDSAGGDTGIAKAKQLNPSVGN